MEISRANAISLKSYCPETHTHRIDCSTWTTKVVGISNTEHLQLQLKTMHVHITHRTVIHIASFIIFHETELLKPNVKCSKAQAKTHF